MGLINRSILVGIILRIIGGFEKKSPLGWDFQVATGLGFFLCSGIDTIYYTVYSIYGSGHLI